MSKKYYLKNAQEKTGPYSLDDLQRMEIAGLIDETVMVIDDNRWLNAREFLKQTNPEFATDDPDKILKAALLQGAKPDAVVTKARWESLLFIISFPVLIPSLIIMFIMAKRWGHVDIYLILIDGLIFTGLACLSSYTLGGVIFICWVASIILYWLRRDRKEYGIFLGYSNLVALLLIFGGSLAIGGFIATAPLQQIKRWNTIRKDAGQVTLKKALDHALPLERTIRFSDAHLDWSKMTYRQKFDGKWQFKPKSDLPEPLSSYTTGDLKKLWAQRDLMDGKEVQLTDVKLAAFANQRHRVEIVDGKGKKTIETPSLYFWLLDESDMRVWLVTKEPLKSGIVSAHGTARIIYNDAATGQALTAALKQNMPYMGIAIFDGEKSPPPPPPPKPEAEEVWVPVAESKDAFWVRFPEGKIPDRSEAAQGIFTGSMDDLNAVDAPSDPYASQSGRRVFYQQTPANYITEQKIVEQMQSSIAWKHAPWLAAGIALLLTAIWRARYE